jgi:hypothetical protein
MARKGHLGSILVTNANHLERVAGETGADEIAEELLPLRSRLLPGEVNVSCGRSSIRFPDQDHCSSSSIAEQPVGSSKRKDLNHEQDSGEFFRPGVAQPW